MRCFLSLVLAALIVATGTPAKAQSEGSVRSFIDRVNEASTALLSSGSELDARQKCRRLLAWAFDVPAMARYTLGDAWDKTTTTEHRTFITAFEDAIVTAYVRRVAANRGMNIAFVGTRAQSDGNRLAATRLVLPDRPEQTWIWRLQPSGQTWRVVDVMIDSRSVVHAERQEYARILEATHGDISAVIDFIRNREARLTFWQ